MTSMDHVQRLPQATTLGFGFSCNENSVMLNPEDQVRNEVSTESVMDNEGNFPNCLVDWNFTTRPLMKVVDNTCMVERDLQSHGGTLVLENLDSGTRDEVLNVLFRHRERVILRIE